MNFDSERQENNQSFKLQAKVAEYDLRNPVQDPSAHPYRGIGKVRVKCYDPQKKQFVTQFGTGSIINKNLILTAAHVLYFTKMNVWGNTIEFYPFQYLGTQDDNKLIKITKFYVDQSYLKQKDKKINLDFAILQLQQNNDIQDDQVLSCNLNYDLKDVKKDIINISGYSSQMKVFKNFQFFEESVALYEQKGFLFYKHTTNAGNSGGPLLLKCNSKRYEIIGLHKGTCGDKNFGPLLKIFRDKIQKFVNLQTGVKIDSYLENCYFTFYRQNSSANDKYTGKEQFTLQDLREKLEKKQAEIDEIKAQYNELQRRKNKEITDLKTKLKQLQNKVQQKNKCGYINEFITREKQRQQEYAKIKNLSSTKNHLEYSVGILISRYPKKHRKDIEGYESNKEFTTRGTAFYIGRGLLLTAARNLFMRQFNQIASQVFFVPQVMNNNQQIDELIIGKSWKVFKNYSDSQSPYTERFDIGLVLLEESKFYNQNGILNIQWDYNSKSQVNKMFKLAGYDGSTRKHNRLEVYDKVLFRQDEFLYYRESKYGQGGGPLVIEDEKSKDHSQKVIGLHRGVRGMDSIGISFNTYQNPQQIICQLVEELNVEDRFPQYQPSYKKLRQLFELKKN